MPLKQCEDTCTLAFKSLYSSQSSGIQIANGNLCDGTRFRIRWKRDVLSNMANRLLIFHRMWNLVPLHESIPFTMCAPQILTKLHRIGKNLIPLMSLKYFFHLLLGKYSQHASKRNSNLIHNTSWVLDKLAQIQNTERKLILTSR